MKKQETNTNNTNNSRVRSPNKKPAATVARNIYTEADLGEDILDLSLGSVYSAVTKSLRNIYGRTYLFNNIF